MTVRHLLASLLSMACILVQAEPAVEPRIYTETDPLIYEDVRDLWPYSFLNEQGQADGFNVDLVRLLLDELHIPYIIKMTHSKEAFEDLKEGRSDLIMGLSTGFHDEYGHYSRTSITLFTQSVVYPVSKPSEVRNLRDLGRHRVMVNEGSLCHHLMTDLGYGENAIPVSDVGEALLRMSTDEEGAMVWNTLSLKWLLRKYQIDNLELQPVNMPHGEYKFMSNDDRLLHQLDSVYAELYAEERLTPLQTKWFYPERKEQPTPRWVWVVGAILAVLLLLLLVYAISYRLQARRITAENKKRNRRLALILETSGVRLWTYDVASRMFTWRNELGQPAYVYSVDEFAQRYSPQDFARLSAAIEQLSGQDVGENGEEPEITLDIQAQDRREDGDTEKHDFVITLSVLRRDKKGMPSVLIGTKKDVTAKRRQEREADERTLRYWALFNTPIVGIILFDKTGRLANINQRACQLFCCDRDEMMAERPLLSDLFGVDVPLGEADGFHATMVVDYAREPQSARPVQAVKRQDRLYNEYRFMTVDDESGQLLGVFAVCSEVSHVVLGLQEQAVMERKVADAKVLETKYVDTIDNFIRNGNVRIVSYSPASHMFTVYNSSVDVQHALTPTRLMTLVDSRMRIRVMHIIGQMDSREPKPVVADIETTLRSRAGLRLFVYVNLRPQYDDDGQVREYLGILRDTSELKNAERQLAAVEAKTQEVEDTKTTFIKNMMQEIRTPMSRVIEKSAQLEATAGPGQQEDLRHDIVENAEQLTHIINNVLYLSRLEAHMVEFVRQPTDFAQIFESLCAAGWANEQSPDVKCVAENPYDQLVIDIDAEHLGYIITQLTHNAARHTRSGVIHTRYDYIGRRLMISIDDTGEGIDETTLQRLNSELASGKHTSSGMGLPICHELLRQMGGHLEILSERGLGTTVWVTLPCQASVIKRKIMA